MSCEHEPTPGHNAGMPAPFSSAPDNAPAPITRLQPRADWTVFDAMVWVADRTDTRVLDPKLNVGSFDAMQLYDRQNPLLAAGHDVLGALKGAMLKARRVAPDGSEMAIAAGYWNSKTLRDDPDYTNEHIVVSAEEVRTAFPAVTSAAAKTGGEVPANRQLDHGEIFERAALMLFEQPNLTKGSAAASIVADLPNNPRTGRPRDTRHIERIIAPLWEGGTSTPPR